MTDDARQDCEWAWTDACVYASQILCASVRWTSDIDRQRTVLSKYHDARSNTVRVSHDERLVADVSKGSGSLALSRRSVALL